MTSFLIVALCVVVLWAGSKVLNHLHKKHSEQHNPLRGSLTVEKFPLHSKPLPLAGG